MAETAPPGTEPSGYTSIRVGVAPNPDPFMYKLILIFHETKLGADFLIGWSTRFVPQADRMPGLRRVTVSHVEGGPAGPSDVRLIHELYFDDRAALTAAMSSPEGVGAGAALVELLGPDAGVVDMLFAEHQEGDLHEP